MSSVSVLKFLQNGKGRLSDLLQRREATRECESHADELFTQIDILTAKGFIKLAHEYDEEDGDDFVLEITETGKAFLRYQEKKKDAKEP